jgi:hypothetical protein
LKGGREGGREGAVKINVFDMEGMEMEVKTE